LEAVAGYRPKVSLEEGVRKFAEWFKDCEWRKLL
jgi:nucleoside-diphosphate-sugar epimerase